MTWCLWEGEERAGPWNLMKKWHMVLQCRAQSTLTKFCTGAGLAIGGCDSFVHEFGNCWWRDGQLISGVILLSGLQTLTFSSGFDQNLEKAGLPSGLQTLRLAML